MKVFVCHSPDEMGKLQAVVNAFPEIWKGSVLDVGCRTKKLQIALPDRQVDYCGFDLFPPADIIGNLEMGLPCEDASFDVVVALDILEHTDNIHKAFQELCRSAKKYLLINLPNAYEIHYRFKFLCGQKLSGKYGLPVEPLADRHRWLFSFKEAYAFTHIVGKKLNFEVKDEGCLIGPSRGFAMGIVMVKNFPNLLSPWYLALLERKYCILDQQSSPN